MGKQIYESEKDRAREKRFMSKIERHFGVKCHKLPYHWEFDMFMSKDGWGVGMGEVKHAFYSKDKYPHALLSKHKIETALRMGGFLGMPRRGGQCKRLPLVMFIRYPDADFYTKIAHPDNYKQKRITASNHADDPTDTEWCCLIPRSEFKLFP